MTSWKIIWLSASREEAVKQSLLVPQQQGLVRSRGKYGLRVPAEAFAEAFRKLRPTDTLPVQVDVKELYKLGPLPIGATSASVTAWIAAIKWPAKVLKSLGPAHWLLGAAASPESAVPCFNGAPVLLSRVHGRTSPAPIVTGNKPVWGNARTRDPGHECEEIDPWTESDPWSRYRPGKGESC